MPGHPLFVPASTGVGRVDNPGQYDVLYLGDSAAGAMAEAFGWAQTWNASLFRGIPAMTGSVRALATYELDDVDAAVCDLDDARRLVDLGLRPSQVVTRDRVVTQRWSADIYASARFAGVRWWSYYDPRWGSYGLWDVSSLSVTSVTVLDDIEQPDFVAAAEVLNRIRG
jgi:hypothetical protein